MSSDGKGPADKGGAPADDEGRRPVEGKPADEGPWGDEEGGKPDEVDGPVREEKLDEGPGTNLDEDGADSGW